MPRQARLDAPGTLHHVIIGGIECKEIVKDDTDARSRACSPRQFTPTQRCNHRNRSVRSNLQI